MKEWKSWCILSASFCFMFCIFAPLETYLTNVQEFWFQTRDLLPLLLGTFAVVSVLLFLAGLLLKRAGILFPYAAAVFFSIYLGLYIQGNFIPRNYGILNGTEIDWEKYPHYGAASLILWSAMLVLCMLMCTKLSAHVHAVCSYTGVVISFILIFTAGTLFVQNLRYEKEKKHVVVSQKDMFSLSEQKNMIVLLYDTFDSSYMRELLEGEDGDAYRDIFEDFTYYPDTAGGYPTTRASMPLILTGQWYENEQPFSDFVNEAYKKTDFYDFLEQNSYSAGMYAYRESVSNDTDMFVNVKEGTYSVKNIPGFLKDIYKLAAFNYLPHQLKKYMVVYTGDYDQYMEMESQDQTYTPMDVPEFFELLEKEKLSVNENLDKKQKNAFRFYHLLGTHPGYEFGEELSKDGGSYTALDEAKGCIRSLKYYCDLLKEKGIYDNSVIIVMADHGFQSDECYKGSNPLLMIKESSKNEDNHEKNEKQNQFQISNVPVSWDNLLPTMKTLISGENHAGDLWSQEEDAQRERRFLFFDLGKKAKPNALPQLTEYAVSGTPADHSFTLMPTGNIYSYSDSQEKKKLENAFLVDGKTEIPVDDEAWDAICICGASMLEFGSNGEAYRWTSEKALMFAFAVEDTSKDYKLGLHYWGKYQENSDQEIIVKINGVPLDQECVSVNDDQKSVFVKIPRTCLTDQDVTVVICFSNAVSPKETGIGEDTRKLTFSLSGVSIE